MVDGLRNEGFIYMNGRIGPFIGLIALVLLLAAGIYRMRAVSTDEIVVAKGSLLPDIETTTMDGDKWQLRDQKGSQKGNCDEPTKTRKWLLALASLGALFGRACEVRENDQPDKEKNSNKHRVSP